MSEPYPEQPPEAGGGGTFLTKKYGGIPGVVWLAGAAVVAYFLFFRGKSSSAAASSSGGGGTPTTGDISIQPGTTTIDLTSSNAPNQPQPTTTPNPQPRPVPPARTKKTAVTYTNYTVKAGETLAQLAKRFGVTVSELARANVYVEGETPGNKKVGQTLGTGAGLKAGQVLRIPHFHTSLT